MLCEACKRDGATLDEASGLAVCEYCAREYPEYLKFKVKLANAAGQPDTPVEFNTPEKMEAWKPAAALILLRQLNVPGISAARLASIQDLRAYFTAELAKLN